jgi:hypothetical protein
MRAGREYLHASRPRLTPQLLRNSLSGVVTEGYWVTRGAEVNVPGYLETWNRVA